MSIAILKTEKPIIVINSKQDVDKLILESNESPDKICDKTIILNVANLHHMSKEYKGLSWLIAQSRKHNLDIIFATNDKVWKRVEYMADSKLELKPTEIVLAEFPID